MKVGFKTSQTRVEWPILLATWQLGDELTVFDSGWVFDHFVALGDPPGGALEAWTTAAALAARTRRLQLGHLVLGNTHRHPALTAKMGATLDHVAPGRFVLGLGASWHEEEHRMYGWRLPPIGERISMLDAAVQICQGMWNSPDRFSFSGMGYELTDARCDPAPLTPGGPPIWLGGQRPRGLRIAARRANGWNHNGSSLEDFISRRDALLRECEAIGRDPSELEVSASVPTWRGTKREVLEQSIRYARAGASHIVLLMEAERGPDGLQQIADEIAAPLRERLSQPA